MEVSQFISILCAHIVLIECTGQTFSVPLCCKRTHDLVENRHGDLCKLNCIPALPTQDFSRDAKKSVDAIKSSQLIA